MLPPAGFVRNRQPGLGSLAVTVAGESGGMEAVFDFSALPGPPALLAACAVGFARVGNALRLARLPAGGTAPPPARTGCGPG